jgi:hypothetical protein
MYRPARRVEGRGRLAGEMRWRLAALLALAGTTVIPATSDAVPAGHIANVNVTVRPSSGGTRTRFAVSFRAPVTTGRSVHSLYRINASQSARSVCQSAATVVAPPTRAGAIRRVVLAPRGSKRWCAGTFRGQVWHVISRSPCRIGEACPALEPRPKLIGKFTFRVTHG